MHVATVKYALEIPSSVENAYKKLEKICKATKEADFLILPEYAGLEWVWLYKKNFYENVEIFQNSGLENYKKSLLELARNYNQIIIGGTLPVQDTQYYNRCYIAYPCGELKWQDKINLTPSEQSLGWLKCSNTINVFNSDFGDFSVCICYDSEFPELASKAVFAGANVIFIPSYTDSKHGAYRVQIAARARAMENQCFTITSTCEGKVNCDEFDGIAIGNAGIFTPVDNGFPEDGILEITENNFMASAVLDIDHLRKIRLTGQVRNFENRINFQPIFMKFHGASPVALR